MKVKKIIGFIQQPYKFFFLLNRMGVLQLLSDKAYLKFMYKAHTGKNLDLDHPRTFNEKLQWLKLYDRNPLYTRLVDKYEAKFWVQEVVGSDSNIIETLGVWDDFASIEFDKLPEKFVLKATHDSGTVLVCDNHNMDFAEAKKRFDKALKRNFYSYGREWPYKDVKPRIIAEKYLDLHSDACAEYKLFCYNGKVHWVMVCLGIAHSTDQRTNDGFDRDFNHLPVRFLNNNAPYDIQKPKEWNELIEFAEKLSKGIPQVRVDTYLLNGQIYFGEMTFYHDSGLCPIEPEEWNEILGRDIILPRYKYVG